MNQSGRVIGSLLVAIGIVLAIYALLFMDTSVDVNYPMGNSFGLPEKVNNLGLLADKQNYLIGAGISIILGLAIGYLPSFKSIDENDVKCPYCAETIKKGAKICRFCNHQL